MERKSWYVLDRGKMSGPYTQTELETMRSRGVLTSFSQISQDRATWVQLDAHLRECHARAIAPAPLQPPPLAGAGRPGYGGIATTAAQKATPLQEAGIVSPFPIHALLLLHYLTGGIFTFFWTTGSHGLLPRVKSDDPSAAKAIGLCLVPVYNLYWFFVVYLRLARRVNSLSQLYRLPAVLPLPMAYLMCILLVIPVAMAMAGCVLMGLLLFSTTPKDEALLFFFFLPNLLTVVNLLVVIPAFAAVTQLGLNRIFQAQMELLLRDRSAAP